MLRSFGTNTVLGTSYHSLLLYRQGQKNRTPKQTDRQNMGQLHELSCYAAKPENSAHGPKGAAVTTNSSHDATRMLEADIDTTTLRTGRG